MGGALVPRVCEGNSVRMGEGAEGCGLDPFVTLPNRSKYVDQQTLKLQVISCTPVCGSFRVPKHSCVFSVTILDGWVTAELI